MALELAPAGSRVNSVARSFGETPMTLPVLEDLVFKRVLGSIPIGRMATAEEVAAAVLSVVSPAPELETGSSLLVDCGWTAQ
jgi:NAD(P)-dependent dehydrogenase (short-subunit alcohol dehydrogenase family)